LTVHKAVKGAAEDPAPAGSSQPGSRRWLILVHQLPSRPSNLRVRTWRRLQQLGAVAVKQAVYVLPDSPLAREDFEWLKSEIREAGGEASVFAADSVDTWSDDELVEEFRRSREEAYRKLSRDLEKALKKITASRQPRSGRAPAARRMKEAFHQRFSSIESVDFFGSAGRDRVATLLAELEERTSKGTASEAASRETSKVDRQAYRRRLWITRPRPGVDRMASAWLIRRFIDREARFGFASDLKAAPRDAVPYDMFGVEFTHRGDHCTFETLCAIFGIDDAPVKRIAAIVHDLDLKDVRFRAPEGPAIAMVIEGLQLAYADDDALLGEGMVLFEALYRSAQRSHRPSGPCALAGSRRRSRGSKPRTKS
jgi:hypothetical protein